MPARPLVFVALLLLSMGRVLHGAVLPDGFANLDPTSMAFAPDGRLFLCEKPGRVRVIKNGALLPTPFVDVSANCDNGNERGLQGLCFDPAFASNHYVYLYYTAKTPMAHNRVVRFTAKGDVASGDETAIIDLTYLSGAGNHNGGGMRFGKDGKLYVSTGENANGANAQNTGNLLGKLLRLNADGSIPTDNPNYATYTDSNRAIVALDRISLGITQGVPASAMRREASQAPA